ncbi:MAG TPA: hypothetical protein VGM44_21950 [Polyangiaceae bacterium]|jgi:hypothetical protein
MIKASASVASAAFITLLSLAACSAAGGTPGTSTGASGSTATGAGGAAGKAGSSSAGSAGTASGSSGASNGGSVGTAGTSSGGAGGSAGGQTTGGSAGSGGTAGGGTTTGCAGLPLCDDFEADASGSTPAGWTLFKPGGCSGSAQYSATIDTTQFHSGSHSVKVTGGDSCGPLLLNTAALASITGGEVYGRFFVRMPSVTAFDHAVMMALGIVPGAETGSFDQAKFLALSPEEIGNTSALVWQTTDNNILPQKAPEAASSTTFPMANTWTCVEFHVSANTNAIETWIDGNAIAGLTFIPGTTAMSNINSQWTPAAIAPTSFGLGWVVFGGPMISLWFDDAALGKNRIGCN